MKKLLGNDATKVALGVVAGITATKLFTETCMLFSAFSIISLFIIVMIAIKLLNKKQMTKRFIASAIIVVVALMAARNILLIK